MDVSSTVIMVFLLVVVVNGAVVTSEEMLFKDIYRCNKFANAVERGESSSGRQPYKWQENISAYCVPKMVNEETEIFE